MRAIDRLRERRKSVAGAGTRAAARGFCADGIGGGTARLVRQMLTESPLLACIAGIAGLAVARWSLAALADFVPPGIAGSVSLELDPRAIAFTALISLTTGLLFGIAPALQVSGKGLYDALMQSGRTSTGRRGRLRDVLVVGEVALDLVLVIGASLLVETILRLNSVDAGFRPEGILTASAMTPFPKYEDRYKRNQFYRRVLERVEQIPGVVSAGLTSDLPFTSRGNTMSFSVEGKPPDPSLSQDALFRLVSAGYFQTLQTPLKSGRFFSVADDESSPSVGIVNETLARQYWPGENPLGHRFRVPADGPWITVVGVVHDMRERGFDYNIKGAIYLPFAQFEPGFFVASEIAVRTNSRPGLLAKSLQAAVWSVDADQPVSRVMTMDEIVGEELANRRQVLRLLGTFAALALILAALGIHGILSYLVAQRRREIGVQLALGASPAMVVRSVISQGMRLTFAGLLIGGLAALAATRLLANLLYGVGSTDLRVFLLAGAALAATGLAACYVPARRAAAVDPIVALREE